MRTPLGRIDPGLIRQLEAEPYRFEFFEAVRLLERYFEARERHDRSGKTALSERIRFGNSLRLGFAPSQIEAYEAEYEEGVSEEDAGALRRVRLVPAFIGLLGLHGTLPAHYTERIDERERYHRDRGARAFLELFSNRAVAQFYRAWKKYRLAVQYEGDRQNAFLPLVLALAGLGGDALRDRLGAAPGGIDDESIAYFAGVLGQRPLSAQTLQRVLEQYFRVPIEVEPLVGRWYVVPPEQRSCLGGTNALLGRTMLVGERIWQRNLRVRIRIGPLARARYLAFLPGSELAAALQKLLGLASCGQFEFEIRPVLRAADVRPCELVADAGPRLGFDAFLCTRDAIDDRSDTLYELHAA